MLPEKMPAHVQNSGGHKPRQSLWLLMSSRATVHKHQVSRLVRTCDFMAKNSNMLAVDLHALLPLLALRVWCCKYLGRGPVCKEELRL